MKIKMIMLLAIVALLPAISNAAEVKNTKDISMLILSSTSGGSVTDLSTLDETFRDKMESEGFTIHIYGANYHHVANKNVNLDDFNLIVMAYPPTDAEGDRRTRFINSSQQIFDYVKKGGGLFIFCDEVYDSYIPLNEFIADVGAEILPENVVDPDEVFRQKGYFREYFCKTDNITPHPITKNVHSLVYPLAWNPEKSRATLTMKIDDNWQVVIRGAKNAYSVSSKAHEVGQKTYTSEPPLVAVRTLGKGRIVLFPTRSFMYIQNGYHPTWESIATEQGDGYRLMVNIIDWLAEPSRISGAVGGYVELRKEEKPKVNLTPEFFDTIEDVYPHMIEGGNRPFITEITHTPRKTNDYIGVIGIYSAYSRGRGSVKEFCDKAKSLGYDYIVFTEDFAYMNEEKWNTLVEECTANSDDDFIAIPGVEIKDTQEQTSVIFNMERWPDETWLDESGRKLSNHPGLYFGLNWPPKAFVDNTHNYNWPFFNKFYSCLEVFAYNRGERFISEVFSWYLQCQANDYNIMPIAMHRLYSPAELRLVTGFKTRVLVDTIANIPSEFKYNWYSPCNVYISEGPKIKEFAMENGRGAYREELWKLYIDVESELPIKEVLVYDRRDVYRRFLPNNTKFKTEIASYHDKQRHFTIMVTDSEGNRAISSALYASDKRHSTYMCTDLQNTINTMYNLTKEGEIWHYVVQGNYVTGWGGCNPRMLAPSKEIWPRIGIEYGYGGWKADASPRIPRIENPLAQRDMVYDSGDCNILDNYYSATYSSMTEYIDGLVRFISFTPRPYSINPMIVENNILFKNEVKLPNYDGPDFGLFETGLDPDYFPYYCVLDPQSKKIIGSRSDLEKPLYGKLPQNGLIATYPDFWGSLGIVPLNGELDYMLTNKHIKTGLEAPNTVMKKGERIKNDYIVIRGAYGQTDESEFINFYDVYGFDGTPAYTVSLEKGKVLDQRFVLKLEAEDYTVKGSITKTDLPNDLGITVTGLCDNWDSGMLEVDDNNLRRVGTLDDTGYLAWNINNRDRFFVIGNIVTCDDMNVKLNLIEENGKYSIYAHNPKDKSVTVTIKTPEWLLPVIDRFNKRVTLSAGETKRFSFE